MESKRDLKYGVNLVYEKYSKTIESITPPKIITVGGLPILQLTTPEGNYFGVNLNFVHRFEYEKTNKEKELKTYEQGNY